MRLPYALGAYQRSATRLPTIICRNQYVEKSPQNPEENVVLLPRPGLDLNYSVGSGPVRGMFAQDGVFGGDIITLSGGALYRGEDLMGPLGGDAVSDMAALEDELFIASGALYSTVGGPPVAVGFPDGADVSSVATIDQVVVAVRADTGRMYFRLPGETTWDALNYFSAEAEPDPVIAVRKVGNELWAFGTSSVQPFNSTGDSAAPFQIISGREYLRGCRARTSIAILDNAAFWVGEDGIAYRGENVPQVISTPAISERIKAANPEDLIGWTYAWDGHTFYALTVIGHGTWVYDVSTGEWHEAASYGLSHWRAYVGVMHGLSVYAGDSESGNVWLLNSSLVADGNDPLERTFTSGLEVEVPLSCDVIRLDATAGFVPTGSSAIMELRWSDDVGNTWSNWQSANMGDAGHFRRQISWRRLGLIDQPGRVFEFRLTDPTPWRLSAVRMNENVGGRSR